MTSFRHRRPLPRRTGSGRRPAQSLRHEPLEQRLLLAADAAYRQATPAWFQSLLPATRAPAVARGAANQSAAPVGQNEWVVRLADTALKTVTSVPDAARALANPSLGVQVVKGLGLTGQLLVRATGTPAAVTSYLRSSPLVQYADPNGRLQAAAAPPTDPRYTDGTLWGLHNTGQSGGTADADIDAPEAWQITTGSDSVVVAVIDTGIDVNHPDLRENIWVNPGEVPGDGIDNDGNGFVDDINGWDFANNDASVYDSLLDDHGTHCAGTIAGRANNGIGVVGVSWNTKIMSLKFLDPTGSTADAIAAINYATMMRSRGVNIRITSNSWGGGSYNQGLKDAIETGGQSNILFVAAAGNSSKNSDIAPGYPAAYDSACIISVAATDRNDGLASFSNYGKVSVDLGAPGVSIMSTTPANTYTLFNGTSMACPHVSGVAALTVALDPTITAAEIKAAILGGVDQVASLNGRTVTGGRLNARNALERARPALKLVSSSPSSRVTGPVSAVTLEFNQAVEAASLVPANFILRGDGDDGTFGTTDDVIVAFSDVAQPKPGTVVASFSSPLVGVEQYVLTVKGTGDNPLRAATGRPLTRPNGDNAASDVSSSFTVWPPQVDTNDTLATATTVAKTTGVLALEATIGNGVTPSRDVDFYRVALEAGQQFTVDINARTLRDTSRLDSVLRLFDAGGRQIAFNDDDGLTLDSVLRFTAPATGTYFVGVSGFGNIAYTPTVAGSGGSGSLGDYQVMFTFGSPRLTADVVDVTPDPRDRGVESVVIAFARPVNGFDIGDLSLTRDGIAVPIGAATLASADRRTWTLAGAALVAATSQSGAYRLTVNTVGRGIADDLGAPLAEPATDEWRTVTAAPQPPSPPPSQPTPPSQADVGDTLALAATTPGLAVGTPFVRSGTVGDGDQRSRDVDFFAVTVAAGQSLTVDIDAASLASRSGLDSMVRLFNASGRLVAFNDNDSRAGKVSRDSYLEAGGLAAGTYYVGISGFGNNSYSPTSLTGRTSGSVGAYVVTIGLKAATVAPTTASRTALAFATLAAAPEFSASPTTAKKRV